MARLRCINIVSLAPEKLAAFYGQVLEASANQLVPGRWELPVGEITLVFTATQEKPVAPPDSCGLEFEAPDVDATYARLTGLGIEMEPLSPTPGAGGPSGSGTRTGIISTLSNTWARLPRPRVCFKTDSKLRAFYP